jgi:hypothetical protein
MLRELNETSLEECESLIELEVKKERISRKGHMTKKGSAEKISFLGNYVSPGRQHRDGYENSKFPFLEFCVTLVFREKIYTIMKTVDKRIHW